MAVFIRLTAAEADLELREMRQLLLNRLAHLEKRREPVEVTQRRIHALNRALQSLHAEKVSTGKLIDHPATRPASVPKPGRSAYGG